MACAKWQDVLLNPQTYLDRIPNKYRQDFLLATRAKVGYITTQNESHIVDLKFFETGTGGAIKEARGYGTSCQLFGDTRDKFVVHPGHLGCKEFTYRFENDSWGECYHVSASFETMVAMNERLWSVGCAFRTLGFEVYIIGISCDGKGYLNVYDTKVEIAEYPLTEEHESVLFVYI